MATSDFSASDLAAITGSNRDGLGDGNGILWLLLFIILGGFGGRGYGGGYDGGAGSVGGNELYPWLNSTEQVNNGFRDQMLNTSVNGIQQGINGITNQLCAGFSGVNAGMAAGFANVEAGANARQMADMQQAFAGQTAMMQGFNGLQSQFADCCCENRLATANQTATILAEHCSDRAALSDGVRDIIAAQAASTQRILDQMCQDKIDQKNDEIAQLRTQIQIQNLAASQNAQTAAIIANNEAQTTALEQYLAPVPRPAYVVQNPNCCGQTFGCGCGV